MSSRKDEMKEWLQNKNIGITEDMLKVDLYSLYKL